MVVHASILTAVLWLFCQPVWGAPVRQLCLSCHSPHYEQRGSCTGCHRGNPASGRREVAHAGLIAGRHAGFTLGNVAVVREGARLMETLACRRCHISAGRGNRLATPLDNVMTAKLPAEIAGAIRQPGSGMPDFRLDHGAIDTLLNAIFFAGTQQTKSQGNQPLVVHFEGQETVGKDVFSRKCGPCHRILTRQQGLLGTGDSGPNLSGLLSPFYPHNFRRGEAWTVHNLGSWLKNPRKIRAGTAMRPVTLTAVESKELESIIPGRTETKR